MVNLIMFYASIANVKLQTRCISLLVYMEVSPEYLILWDQLARNLVEEAPSVRSTSTGRSSLHTTPPVPPPNKTSLRTAVSLPSETPKNRQSEKRYKKVAMNIKPHTQTNKSKTKKISFLLLSQDFLDDQINHDTNLFIVYFYFLGCITIFLWSFSICMLNIQI